MGLDMYLEGRRYLSRNDYNFRDFSQPPTVNEAYAEVLESADLTGLDTDEAMGLEVRFTVGYWRKANHIHGWIVNNIANGVDECQPIWISRESLNELRMLCNTVMAIPHRAPTLLPFARGFFFGGDSYDEWYFRDTEKTIQILDKALSLPEEIDFIYQASW